MSKTFHVKRSERTHERVPISPAEWREHKRINRRLQKTYVDRINFAAAELEAAEEVGNNPRARKFRKILDRTQERLEELS